MEDHEDYLPGEAPAAHKTTHQDGGTDEISIADLAGVSTELAAHALLPTVHQDAPALILTHKGDAAAHHAKYTDGEAQAVADTQIATHTAIATAHQDAPALILTHKGDAAAHHAKYTDGEAQAVADTQIATHTAIATAHQDAPALILTHKGDASAHHQRYTAAEVTVIADALINTHAGLPTVHQDAPALILTHKGDASAHHARYTDAEVRSLFSPISLHPSACFPSNQSYDWTCFEGYLKNRTALNIQYFFIPLLLPNGATVTKLTLYGYRDDAAATLNLSMSRAHRLGGSTGMAAIVAAWTDGWNTAYDDTIANPTIDNGSYSYCLTLSLNPNDNVLDVQFSGAKIDLTG